MGTGFLGLYELLAALATALTLVTATNWIDIRLQRGTNTRRLQATNDSTCAPTLTNMGTSFVIDTGGVPTLYVADPTNGASIRVQVKDEVTNAVFKQQINVDPPTNKLLLSPQPFINKGTIAAAVA